MPSAATGRVVQFGAFEFDLESGDLRHHARKVHLQEQPARLLALLVRRPGEVVTRDELRQALWPDGTFVEFDTGLNAAITKIRRALRDSPATPRFIETVPRRGYKFLADVHGLDRTTVATSLPPPAARVIAESVGPHRSRRALGVTTLALVVLTLVSVWLLSPVRNQSARSPEARTLAVQPFEIGGATWQPNLGAELASAVARRLGRLQALTVKPWPPSDGTGGRGATRDVGVATRLIGVLTRRGPRMAIDLQLASPDGHSLWTDAFDVPFGDVIWLESQIAQRVAKALDVPMSGRERAALARHMTESLEAYQWFLRGRWFFDRRTARDLREAAEAFQRATTIDPSYALAYAWIANAWGPLGYLGFAPPWEAASSRRASLEKALLLDDNLAEAYLGLASDTAFYAWRWAEAEATYRRALELDPTYATGHHWYAFYLQHLGRFDEAFAERRRALEIDSQTPMLRVGLAELYVAARQPERAIDELRSTLERSPRFWYARWVRGQALGQIGRSDEALADLIAAERAAPDTVPVVASLIAGFAAKGRTGDARRRLADVMALSTQRFVPPFDLALIHVALGDADAAFEWLRRGCDIKDIRMSAVGFHWGIDPLRQDPRFREVLACVGVGDAPHGTSSP